MFRGIFHNSMDDKGRVSIPSKLREQLKSDGEGPLVVTLGFDQCLFLYPAEGWKKIEEQLSSLNTLNSEVRQLQRTILGNSDEVELDGQGRIVISPVLRKAAGLGKGVVVAGMLNHIEIWDKTKYESYQTQTAQSLDVLGQKLSEKGIPPLNL
jgi:MraZ protein